MKVSTVRRPWPWARAPRPAGASRGAKKRPAVLTLEAHEERAVPAILWTNQGSAGSDTDGFNAVYGANAAAARAIVSQAITDWDSVIVNFNYANVGTAGNAPTADTYRLTVNARTFS